MINSMGSFRERERYGSGGGGCGTRGRSGKYLQMTKETAKHENLTILCATLNIITTVYIETERELKQ